jgi:hypothetical protein
MNKNSCNTCRIKLIDRHFTYHEIDELPCRVYGFLWQQLFPGFTEDYCCAPQEPFRLVIKEKIIV